MSQVMLNEKTFAPDSAAFAGAAARPTTMTLGGTIAKTLFLIVVAGTAAVFGWSHALQVLTAASGPSWLLWYILLIAMSLAAVARPRLAPIGGLLYAVIMGLWMGGISAVFEAAYEGVVGQALIGTIATVVVCLLLYATGAVKVSNRMVMTVLAATLGIGLLYLFGWIMSLFGVNMLFWTTPNTTGIIISAVIALVAALNLFLSFRFIDEGVQTGAPKFMEWYSAWGLLATVIWLYIEVLRLIVLIRARQ